MSAPANKTLIVILVVAACLTGVFIFGNSLQSTSDSLGLSHVVAVMFEPVLRRLYGLWSSTLSWTAGAAGLTYEVFVRKLAHFLEYAALGAECAGVAVALAGRAFSPYTWAALFVPLGIAVVDEFVQGFVGRTSLVTDVLLDYSGALTGIAVVLVIAAIAFKLTRKK